MSLKGRWVTLAREWLLENAPCTVDQYVDSVSPLMPTHIKCFRSRKDSKWSLAKEALRRLTDNKGFASFTVVDDVIFHTPKNHKNCFYGFSKRFAAGIPESVDVRSTTSSANEKSALAAFLRYRGYSANGRGVYTKQTSPVVGDAGNGH